MKLKALFVRQIKQELLLNSVRQGLLFITTEKNLRVIMQDLILEFRQEAKYMHVEKEKS